MSSHFYQLGQGLNADTEERERLRKEGSGKLLDSLKTSEQETPEEQPQDDKIESVSLCGISY